MGYRKLRLLAASWTRATSPESSRDPKARAQVGGVAGTATDLQRGVQSVSVIYRNITWPPLLFQIPGVQVNSGRQ